MADSTVSTTRVLDRLLCQQNTQLTYDDPEGIFYTPTSTADCFEINDGQGTLRVGLHDAQLHAIVNEANSGRTPRVRIIFFNGIQNDPNRLPVTAHTLKHIFDSWSISPRFIGFLKRQVVPGRALHNSRTGKASRYELWYSAVIRSLFTHGNQAVDLSRKLLDWSAFCIWSDYIVETQESRFLVWRCPQAMKTLLCETFMGPRGQEPQRHPMVIHAWFIEHIMMHTYDFLQKFSEPLYAWENKASDMRTAEDYTRRSRSFLALSRQIMQVATDYDILSDTVEHLQKAQAWFDNELTMHAPVIYSEQSSSDVGGPREMRSLLQDVFDRCEKEIKLVRTYNTLYMKRTKTGVSECFALVNQRDADVNLKMASESTLIARASFQDNKSLKIIQIMSMLFLPASLVSSIFGMGFFNTSYQDNGQLRFAISSNWWWYVAVSVPLTVFIIVFMGGFQMWDRKRSLEIKLRKGSIGGDSLPMVETYQS